VRTTFAAAGNNGLFSSVATGLVRFNDFHADPGTLKRQIDLLAQDL